MDEWGDLPGRLVVVSGPSGAGKSTVARRLVEYPGVRARLSVSATTRAPRGGEREGVDYFFVTREQFEAARGRGEFLEWAEVHGHLYGTPIGPIREMMAAGSCPILVIDVQGGLQVRERVPGALLVFVNTPSPAVLEARLRARGTDDEATVRRRLENARREVEVGLREYPIQVVNEDLDRAVAALVAVLGQHGCGG
jgi:guanylate kinase